jgi:pimeloyl-ACP methyl ester carboxylesterase
MKRFLMSVCILAGSSFAVQAQEVQTSFGGLKLNADYEKTESWAQKTAIILHGSMAHKDMEIIQSMQDLLKDKGISSLAISLSLGQSNRTGMGACDVVHDHRQEDAQGELAAWVKYLHAQGVKKIDLVSHSRGGQQIAQYALEHPEQIEKLALIAPMTYEFKPSAENTQAQKLIKAGKSKQVMDAKRFLHCTDVKATARSVASYAQNNPNLDTPSLLAKMSQPVLVVMGSEDRVVENLPEKMKGVPAAKVVTVEGADHFFLDLYIEEAMDAIGEFLAD